MSYQDDLNNAKALFDSGALSSDEYNKLKESLLQKQAANPDSAVYGEKPVAEVESAAAGNQAAEPGVQSEPQAAPDFGGQSGNQAEPQPTYQQDFGAAGQQQYGQAAGQQNYQQPNYGQQGAYQQPNYGQQGAYQQSYGQPNPQWGPPPYYAEMKSKIAAGLLGIFLGHLGIHNFYLGFTGKAVTQLVLSIIGYCTIWVFGLGLVLLIIAGIWGLVGGIMILAGSVPVDARGVPLKE